MTFSNIKVIFEGHYMTYKSSLVRYIVKKKHLPYISGEWDINDQINQNKYIFPTLSFPISEYYDFYNKSIEGFSLISNLLLTFPKQVFLLERFHISTNFFEKKYLLKLTDFTEIEEILSSLNTFIIFCYRDPETYYDALNIRLKENRENIFCKDIYPKNKQEYKDDVKIYRDLLNKSKLKVIELDTTEGNLNYLFEKLKLDIYNEYNKIKSL